jgi:hypothetical protein
MLPISLSPIALKKILDKKIAEFFFRQLCIHMWFNLHYISNRKFSQKATVKNPFNQLTPNLRWDFLQIHHRQAMSRVDILTFKSSSALTLLDLPIGDTW